MNLTLSQKGENKVANECFDNKVTIKVEHIDELEHFDEGVKIKIEPTNEFEHFDSELEGKVKELQSKIVCQNNKLKIQEGEREKKKIDYIYKLYDFK